MLAKLKTAQDAEVIRPRTVSTRAVLLGKHRLYRRGLVTVQFNVVGCPVPVGCSVHHFPAFALR